MASEVGFLSEGFLLDIVDDEWRMGTLPDDDVPLPGGVDFPFDEIEDGQSETAPNANETWNELGLQSMG
eukprot:CAMPEP_0196574028 /NCGR_PEP_ID=MMETSP1081-20130531/3822_1 /TAXON_ID=36882 /ORGANISM="Pyramimonas amylifera, Strain CCMP720" /LENGTH=68 /DNA_ID=CAMNT_0041891917 /DNA_START=86 /DNA_END=292 /DNA_ORIENTATION=+